MVPRDNHKSAVAGTKQCARVRRRIVDEAINAGPLARHAAPRRIGSDDFVHSGRSFGKAKSPAGHH